MYLFHFYSYIKQTLLLVSVSQNFFIANSNRIFFHIVNPYYADYIGIFQPFCSREMAQVVEILPHWRQRLPLWPSQSNIWLMFQWWNHRRGCLRIMTWSQYKNAIYLSIYLVVYSLHHNVLPTLQSVPLMTNGPLYPITQDSSCHGQHTMPRNPWSFPMTSSA